MRRMWLPVSALAMIAAAGALWVGQATASSSVSIGLHSFSISKSASSVPHGTVTFHIKNAATIVHNFRIRKGTAGAIVGKSPNLAGGKAATVTVTLAKGTYTIFCSIHPTLMHTTFKVT